MAKKKKISRTTAKKRTTKKASPRRTTLRKKTIRAKAPRKKTTRKKVAARAKKKTKKKTASKAARTSAAERRVRELETRRRRLMGQLAGLDEQLATAKARAGMGVSAVPSHVVEALRDVLSDKAMKVSDAAEAVRKRGYAVSSTQLRKVVDSALRANRKLFTMIEEGLYTVRR